ncbi:MAG: hypothetical protein IJX81_06610 [Clostridia bacterium]|nr:hypothetical protein [Clostridia bacterium]
MSFSAEEIKQRKRKARLKRLGLFLLIVLIAVLVVVSSIWPAASWKYYFALPRVERRGDGELKLHFLNVGRGECTLIEFPDGKTMLVDGGSPYGDDVDRVMRYLNALSVKKLDYVAITAPTEERTGALSEIAAYKQIGYVYLPKEGGDESDEYLAFVAAIKRENVPSITFARYLAVEGDAATPYSVRFLLPCEDDEKQRGSAIWIEWQNSGVLLCGDLTAAEEQKLLADEALGYFSHLGIRVTENTRLLRMPNMGKATEYTAKFIDRLSPDKVVVSCLETNSYTPDIWAVPLTSTAYRTDLNGNIVATVTAGGVNVRTEK